MIADQIPAHSLPIQLMLRQKNQKKRWQYKQYQQFQQQQDQLAFKHRQLDQCCSVSRNSSAIAEYGLIELSPQKSTEEEKDQILA